MTYELSFDQGGGKLPTGRAAGKKTSSDSQIVFRGERGLNAFE